MSPMRLDPISIGMTVSGMMAGDLAVGHAPLPAPVSLKARRFHAADASAGVGLVGPLAPHDRASQMTQQLPCTAWFTNTSSLPQNGQGSNSLTGISSFFPPSIGLSGDTRSSHNRLDLSIRYSLRVWRPLSDIAIIDIGDPAPVGRPTIIVVVGVHDHLQRLIGIEPVIAVQCDNHIFRPGLTPLNGPHRLVMLYRGVRLRVTIMRASSSWPTRVRSKVRSPQGSTVT